MDNKEFYVVIPAYDPNHLLIDLINNLNRSFPAFKYVVVNDGSTKSDDIFKTLSTMDKVTVLTHEVNKGKGATLKTAFRYLKENDVNAIIVMCDADGQHSPEDIKNVVQYYEKHDIHGIILGCREFSKDMPKRSKFGNDATVFLYRLVNQYYITDNQTGLRVFSNEILDDLIAINGDRYEYEMNMLTELNRKGIDIYETRINTIYIDNNKSSHFRPVKDFLKICRNILKYGIPGFIGFCLEIGVFILFISLFQDKFTSLFALVLQASLVSGIISFLFDVLIKCLGILYSNKWILKYKKKRKKYLLVSFATIITNALITSLFVLLINDVINAKISSEIVSLTITFVVRYLIIPEPKIV